MRRASKTATSTLTIDSTAEISSVRDVTFDPELVFASNVQSDALPAILIHVITDPPNRDTDCC